jgi:hypothetical protein
MTDSDMVTITITEERAGVFQVGLAEWRAAVVGGWADELLDPFISGLDVIAMDIKVDD